MEFVRASASHTEGEHEITKRAAGLYVSETAELR